MDQKNLRNSRHDIELSNQEHVLAILSTFLDLFT